MKNIKFLLLGIALLLFGISAILLAGLDLPTYHNGIYELLGVLCPIAGIGAAVLGFFMKDNH